MSIFSKCSNPFTRDLLHLTSDALRRPLGHLKNYLGAYVKVIQQHQDLSIGSLIEGWKTMNYCLQNICFERGEAQLSF